MPAGGQDDRVEIETTAQLRAALADGRPLKGMRLQSLDLTEVEDEVLARDPSGAVVLGGVLSERLERHLRSGGALVFPAVPSCPIDPYRADLYTAEELYAGLDDRYEATVDARAYAWSKDPRTKQDIFATMLRAVHDDSISDALVEGLAGRSVVGVMGGHALERGTDGYAQAARLGRDLARDGHLVLTGGGPGAMEAANLGARLHAEDDDALDDALQRVAAVPLFEPDVAAWARVALDVLADHPAAHTVASIGVPTWFYGHEPPNVFAGKVAKFFSNALREDLLLVLVTAGIVYLPGAAGTVQELFQAATPGYYSERGGVPLVLLGRDHWQERLPAWPLLTALSRGRALEGRVHLVDAPDDHDAVLAALLPADRATTPPRP
jgi:predicted Rossmann-fold nucleotide-binding protein